jgi:asparagine synthase (glutamine-hydrolysing)
MCGISAIWYKYNPDYRPLVRMVEHQKHRGPDENNFIVDGNLGIGFNRLSIVDLSNNGSQPKQNERWVMTFNGEIYDYERLWPGSRGDTEALFNYLNTNGFDKTLQDIEGMFAIVAYDKLERKLHAAVDPTGVKPLYYYVDHEKFACASSPGALSTVKSKWKFSRQSLIDYLALGATWQPFFEGMFKLFGGHKMTVDSEHYTNVSRYYTPRCDEKQTESDVLQKVLGSVKKTSFADVPVSMFLSGGIDSTVVASRFPSRQAIHLDSVETTHAQNVATRYGIALTVIKPADYNAAHCLTDYARQSGDCSAASIVPYMVSREVARKGIKCAISSNGADELFFGYNRIGEYTTDEQIRHIFRYYFYRDSTWSAVASSQSRELELQTYVENDLNKTLDFASMCHSLEVRVPYLNKSVIEAALSLPRKTHVNGYGNKSILKKYLISQGFTFDFIQRPKIGFSLFSEPQGYEVLKDMGVGLLANEFKIAPKFVNGSRDDKYYRSAAAAFYCWYDTWKDMMTW